MLAGFVLWVLESLLSAQPHLQRLVHQCLLLLPPLLRVLIPCPLHLRLLFHSWFRPDIRGHFPPELPVVLLPQFLVPAPRVS